MTGRIVVTGAAGFIGSHLSKRLEKNNGSSLTLVDDFSRGKQEYLDYLGVKTKCNYADLRDYETAEKFTKNADIVYHIACRIGGMQFLHGSAKKELKALQDNLAIDSNTFRACVKNKVKKIIYTSSVSVYNTYLQNHSTEAVFSEHDLKKQKLDPEGGYGWAKYMGEKQLEMMAKTGIKVGIARIFKSYGPCDDYSPESGQVVLSLMRKAINYPDEPYVVWGDGQATRCLVYIDDLIDALIKMEGYLQKKSITVNLGGDIPHKIRELAERIVELSGKKVNIKYDKSKPSGPKSRIPNLDRANEELNWRPSIGLDYGLRKSYDWMKEVIK
ncbi:MAG: NAD-dependent epimerase/dehydratase family protein [Petrotogales bacterium]